MSQIEARSPQSADAGDGVALPARREWLLKGAVVSAAAALLTLHRATASVGNEESALGFLQELELMQSDFFANATASAAFQAMEQRERDVFNVVALQDLQHSQWLVQARRQFNIDRFGGMYSRNASSSHPPRSYNYPTAALRTRASLLPLAVAMKDASVGSYHSVVGSISDAKLVTAIAALAGVEGRHAATLREISGVNPVLSAFEPRLSLAEVAQQFEAYGFRAEDMQ